MPAPPIQWIKQQPAMNTSLDDLDPSIAVDSNGNTYVAYRTTGTVSGGTTAGGNDIVVFKLNTNGNVAWVRQQRIWNTSDSEENPSIAVDSVGNIYVSYDTTGTVSSGTKTGVSDIVVFKMDTNGNVTWINQQRVTNASSSNNYQSSITVDSAGSAYVAYRTTGTVSGGTTAGGNDIVVFKLDTNGNVTWIRQQRVMNTSDTDSVPSIGVDLVGNTYVAYQTFGTVSGGTNAGNNDIVVFKLDTNGNVAWIKQNTTFNTSSNELSPSIAIDSFGNVYVTYQTSGTVSGGTTAGGNDIVVFKLDTNGNVTWIRQQRVMNTSDTDSFPSIAVDSSGNVYVAYRAGGTVSGGTAAGSGDIAVFKLDMNGNVTWITQQKAFNTAGGDTIPSIAIDSTGNIYVAYQTTGTVSGGTLLGGSDIVVFKMGFPLPPVAPTITVKPTVLGPTSIRYDWTTLPSLTYTITLTDGGANSFIQSALTTDNATFSNLTPGTNYTATIYATDVYNQNSPVSTYNVVPLGLVFAPTITANPILLSPTSIQYNWVTLPSLTYTITLTDGTTSDTQSSLTTNTATFSNLTTGTPYTATIYATDTYNQNGPPATYTTVPLGILPSAPTVRRTPRVSPTAVSYYWTPSPTISSYTVTLTGTGSGTGTQTLPSLSQSCTFNQLTSGATYAATIYATDYFNQTGSVASYTTVQPCSRPGPPTNVDFTASNGMLTVTWSPPVDDGIPLRGYVIRDTNRTRTLTFGVKASLREYTVAIPSGTYRFQIAAVNYAGHGTPVVSNQFTF